MRFSELAKLVPCLDPSVAIFFLGRPGIGKSALAKGIGETMGPEAIVKRRELTAHLPEDMSGLPFLKDGFTHFCPVSFFAELAKGAGPNGTDPYGALVLEDITQAQQAVKVACFQLVQERSIGDLELSPNVRIILTGNRTSDKAGARDLPSPLKNRVMILDLEPDIEEWMHWAGDQGLPGSIGGFLNWKSQFFAQTPADACKENGQIATPRSWENTGRIMNTIPGDNEAQLFACISGLLGIGTATEFCGFLRLQKELPDPKAVLDNPKKALPKPPKAADRLTAMVTAIGEYAAKVQHKDKGIYLKLLLALHHVAGEMKEFCAGGLTVFQANNGNVPELYQAAAANTSDPRVLEIISHFANAVSNDDGTSKKKGKKSKKGKK